ncbi:Abi family protein [Fulvivirga sedimenti]|uniref:Abi family protein n=1 Tax=Fulvivirga sedimenti TaxID=2879465 RepID=A0A9X1KZY1_9BACT|nr:Abi family protein [Fulvivirga sedimenti]MCA6078815.1 Abi family protein [Fulvivirga sedimenti]
MNFDKPALSNYDLIEKLEQRGLTFTNKDSSLHYLTHIGYYRLTGYMYPFQDNDHNFKEKLDFNRIIEYYIFDKNLRYLLLDIFERIEVSLRSVINNEITLETKDVFWYRKDKYFKDKKWHAEFIEILETTCKRSSEQFLEAFYLKYNDDLPPSWMVFEILTIGQLASLYEKLDTGLRIKISKVYGMNHKNLVSWFSSYRFVRNICAHHGRLWNRKIFYTPVIPKNRIYKFLNNINKEGEHRLYHVLCTIQFLIVKINPSTKFSHRLKDLLDKNSFVPQDWMGFPENWQDETIWS